MRSETNPGRRAEGFEWDRGRRPESRTQTKGCTMFQYKLGEHSPLASFPRKRESSPSVRWPFQGVLVSRTCLISVGFTCFRGNDANVSPLNDGQVLSCL